MENLLEELQQLLKQKRSEAFYAERLGVTEEKIKQMKLRIKESLDEKEVSVEMEDDGEVEIKYDLDKGEIKCSGLYSTPLPPEEIIQIHQIDTKQYKLSSYWSVQRGEGWRISALFTKLPQQEKALSSFQEFLSSYGPKDHDVVTPMLNTNYVQHPSCAVLSLTDFHLDKKNITEETFAEKTQMYMDALKKLVMKAYASSYVEEIVFVIGNDFYQTDTIHSTTTAGTPVDSDGCWDKAYELGFTLLVNAIVYLRSFCSHLRVVLVPGNHSRTKEFYLAHALDKYFEKDEHVTFDRTSDSLKVYSYGETLFCFHHGDCINDKLPLAFATSFYKEWGNSKYKEILLGDKHHNVQKIVKNQGEDMGVRMRILPSLTGTDAWHQKNLFINAIQAGVILVYDKTMGKVAEFEHRIAT